jgi:NTP pyrophosphatase (non-canonical NTP hydrolase)
MTFKPDETIAFLHAVRDEVRSAQAAFPGQEDTVPLAGWLAILVEEVGEVARELNEDLLNPLLPGNQEPLRKRLHDELVQVAAMAERMSAAATRQLS